MTYCEVADVKGILVEIESSDETYDAEIEVCITSAEARVDAFLLQNKLTMPSPVPQLLKDATIYFTGWLFRRRRTPSGSPSFWTEGTRFFNAYVDSVTHGAPFKVVNS